MQVVGLPRQIAQGARPRTLEAGPSGRPERPFGGGGCGRGAPFDPLPPAKMRPKRTSRTALATPPPHAPDTMVAGAGRGRARGPQRLPHAGKDRNRRQTHPQNPRRKRTRLPRPRTPPKDPPRRTTQTPPGHAAAQGAQTLPTRRNRPARHPLHRPNRRTTPSPAGHAPRPGGAQPPTTPSRGGARRGVATFGG